MFKKLIILFALVSFGSLAASAQSKDPASEGLQGYKPYWVNAGVGFQPKSKWESALEYKKEKGSPKTSTEGVPFVIGGGANVLPWLDVGLEYIQSSELVIKGTAGDEISFSPPGASKETYTFKEDRKVKLSFSGVLLTATAGVNYNSFRFFVGTGVLAGQAKSNVDLKKKGTFVVPTIISKLGVGYFVGDFFPYINLAGNEVLGVRYHF